MLLASVSPAERLRLRQTTLPADDLRNTAEVWQQMFDAAKTRIDLGQFYVANQSGTLLNGVLQHLKVAGERGVNIRFLMEEKGVRLSTPDTPEQRRAIPNLERRIIPYARLSGGILHAKYLLVDGEQAYVGSQNFDWRTLVHIHETGLRISDAKVAGQIQAIFEQDWQAQALLAQNKPVPALPYRPTLKTPRGNYLAASPRAYNPAGVIHSKLMTVDGETAWIGTSIGLAAIWTTRAIWSWCYIARRCASG